MNRKLIFLDIDGTLTSPGSNIPPESALKAIGEARKAGHKVFLCTGRNPDMLAPVLAYGFDGAVACSGGYIICGDKVLYDCPMTEEQKELPFASLRKAGCTGQLKPKTGVSVTKGFRIF
ncbi:MAG: HAD hydrolase family protein [Anaerolineaceae bacterium]|nr:HAD hydrolase family protein [Anaerolineaceae bacterium]